jgi:hypothetical protein
MADQQSEDKQQPQSNIKIEYNAGVSGMNMDNTVNQIQKGTLTYALNAAVENYDANSVNYQNEPGNEWCLQFPSGYHIIGTHFISEQTKHIFFLVNPNTEDSEIGYMLNNDCKYHTYVNAKCLNFNINYPIQKSVHKKTNCTTELYWTDGFNSRRYLDLDDITKIYTVKPGTDVCQNELLPIIDCNKLNIQPRFSIPELKIKDITNGGDLKAGTYQFAFQYCDSVGDGYTSYYSITNPTPIADTHILTLNFDYNVGKSIWFDITDIDTTGYYKYFNIAVIKTINNITSVELVGTYFIDKSTKEIIYTGQNVTQSRLTINDIFEKFPYYDIAQDVTAVQDILVWDQLTSIERINYQQIANKIDLQWQTYRIPNTENYSNELNSTNLRGYLRDEIYAFEIVFILKNGKQTDGFHIPGRTANGNDLIEIPNTNLDFIGEPDRIDNITGIGYSPTWKIYNTGNNLGYSPEYVSSPTYKGPYQYGNFSYWESIESYPCNEKVWGNLANQPIRHHKFPDVNVSSIFESPVITSSGGQYAPVIQNDAIFPIGIKIDVSQIYSLIQQSSLSQDQKNNIQSFKIVRGDRSTNKSIIGKGILRNIGQYDREDTPYFYPNYPYNDLRIDPFLNDKNNAYSSIVATSGSNQVCRNFSLWADVVLDTYIVEYTNCYTNHLTTITIPPGDYVTPVKICALDYPKPRTISGNVYITCNTYDRYRIQARSACFSWIPVDTQIDRTGRYVFDSSCNAPCGPPPSGYINWIQYSLAHHNDSNWMPYVSGPFATLNVFGFYSGKPTFPGWYISNFSGTSGIIGQYSPHDEYVNSINVPYCTFNANVEADCVNPNGTYIIEKVASFGYDLCSPKPLNGFTDDNKYRLVFNSPETSFGQPFLGNILKLENLIYGGGKAHFVQVKKNANYKLISAEAQQDALLSCLNIANKVVPTDITALFTAYQAYLSIYLNGITRRNYGWSFNSILSYDYWDIVNNYELDLDLGTLGIKQRKLDIAQYLIPGVQSVGDIHNINNWNRESSVYLKTTEESKLLTKKFSTYSICNMNAIGKAPLQFEITSPYTGKTIIVILPTLCRDVDSTSYPKSVSSNINTNYTVTIINTTTATLTDKTSALPFPNHTPSIYNGQISTISDNTRFILSDKSMEADCYNPGKLIDTKSVLYYSSIKNIFINQWGQMYSYDTIDTGFQRKIDEVSVLNPSFIPVETVFGGDTFISRFAFKIKLPFFIDNRVGAPDDSDIFYDEIGNVAYPKYWHSARSILSDYLTLSNFISIKAHNFDCKNIQFGTGRTYYDGKMYQFAYGIPNFYCESSINIDLRQAFNNKEGDFWSHVSTGIPDDWVQESYVPIVQDNTYYYNVTYSRQNKENLFTHLPIDWTEKFCYTHFPFRAIYSDIQVSYTDNTINNWLIYRPISKFDFPQNYGNLVSLDGIQNKSILARFENKSLLYNNLLTINTSNPQAAYLGNPSLFAGAPPVDFAETDLGYVGSQNKMLLKIPQGQITIDAKRGQVFLIEGIAGKVTDLSALGSGLNRFFTDHLSFEILRWFPDVDVDNHFKGIGLHGVYDSKYDRVIISKLDYIPQQNKKVNYDSVIKEFYIEETVGQSIIKTIIYITDNEYFCNKSWTLSFNMNTKTWISFHSYIPNWYVAENNFFYSGLNEGCDLEAIAFEELGCEGCPPTTTTTSTSTTLCPTCRPIPIPTTSTTTTILYCDLEGRTVVLDCALNGRAIDMTSPPTPTSTTSTTTTLCPCCNTYKLTNTSEYIQTAIIISCTDQTDREFTLNIAPNTSAIVCSCEEPSISDCISSSIIGSGCEQCFCYTIYNITGDNNEAVDIQWIDCEGLSQQISVGPNYPISVCAKYNSIRAFGPIEVISNYIPCSVDDDCSLITTTTTTTIYCTTTTTSTTTIPPL